MEINIPSPQGGGKSRRDRCWHGDDTLILKIPIGNTLPNAGGTRAAVFWREAWQPTVTPPSACACSLTTRRRPSWTAACAGCSWTWTRVAWWRTSRASSGRSSISAVGASSASSWKAATCRTRRACTWCATTTASGARASTVTLTWPFHPRAQGSVWGSSSQVGSNRHLQLQGPEDELTQGGDFRPSDPVQSLDGNYVCVMFYFESPAQHRATASSPTALVNGYSLGSCTTTIQNNAATLNVRNN